MPRRSAGHDDEQDTYRLADLLPQHDPALQARPYSVLADLTVWATSPEEAQHRLRCLLEKPQPQYAGYRALVRAVRRTIPEPVRPTAQPSPDPEVQPPA